MCTQTWKGEPSWPAHRCCCSRKTTGEHTRRGTRTERVKQSEHVEGLAEEPNTSGDTWWFFCSAQPHDTKAWLYEDLGTSIHVQITQKLNGETHCSLPMKMDELLILAALWMKFCTIMLVEKGLVEGLLYSTWSHFYTEFYKWRLMSDDWSSRCGKTRLGKEGCIYEMSLENFIQLSLLPWLRLLHTWKH